MDALWWVLSVALIAAGLAGTVLPALPGTALVLAGIALGAWIDDFSRVGPWALGAVAAMAVLAWVLDYVAALLGARRAGASRQALVGAAAGEYLAQRDQRQAMKVGVATWLGLMAGLLAKVVLAFMMVGVFVGALLF